MADDTGARKIRRALLSVSDKSGLEHVASALIRFDVELISTGGTRRFLTDRGYPVTDISTVTGNPEAFDGRMKTISFALESSILFNRDLHAEEADRLGIAPIDLVVCNFYPFHEIGDEHSMNDLIDRIDIGGPTMVRAAAKNAEYVAIIVDPTDYPGIVEELDENEGALLRDTRLRLMRKAFCSTADYDGLIATTLDRRAGDPSIRFAFNHGRRLRYGENSHQTASFYRFSGGTNSLHDLVCLHGKDLSFNNILDIHSAIDAVRGLKRHGCSVVKHSNPCGMAEAPYQRHALELAWNGDPVSAFGSIIALNDTVDRETVSFLSLDADDKRSRKFIEVMIAPAYDADAIEYLRQHKSLRIITFDPADFSPQHDARFVFNGLLFQDTDACLYRELSEVTNFKCDVDEDLIRFGLIAVRNLKSKAIAIVRRMYLDSFQLLGMGCGQPNRLVAIKLALDKSVDNLERETSPANPDRQHIANALGSAILISDAFLPFPDNVDICAEYGIKTIIQPGGSIRDRAIIKRCVEHGITMIFTKIRHFRH